MKTLAMLGLVCLAALIIELDFFIALPKFGAEHFGAPDDLKELVKKIPDKSKATVAAGIAVMVAAFAGVIAVLVWAVADSYKDYQGIWQTFLRFLIIFDGYKLFDVICFDWLLLTKIKFPERLYPETAGAKGYESFGFNAKSQITKFIVFAVIAIIIAAIMYFIKK